MGTQPGAGDTAVIPPAAIEWLGLPQPGQQFGHYQILQLLGAGGMGAVYEAEDLDSGRRMALKVLGHALDSPHARQRFFREGRLAASVNHPNSVYVFGTEEISGVPVIAMELVLGGTLRERVVTQGPMPPGEAVDAVLQVIAGLEAAQKLGVLHRDVKPSNCFVDADGTIKIGDFGLSLNTAIRTDSNLTATGVYIGTPAFSPPEQLRGEELSLRSDIYAVGVTLYYLLTGRMPFEAPNMVQLLATVLERRAEPPTKWRAEIPKGLSQTVLKCLEKDPGERFQNYQDLRAALLPYSSAAPAPAALGVRFLAGVADNLLLSMVGMLIFFAVFGGPTFFLETTANAPSDTFWVFAAGMIAVLAYYAFFEGIRGASLGKALFRLRVVGPARNPPGVARALLRAVIFLTLPSVPYWLYMTMSSSPSLVENNPIQMVLLLFYYFIWAALFSTARLHNGFAAVHDLLTRTRVLRQPASTTRPALGYSEPAQPGDTGQMVGPYHVLEILQKSNSEQWLVGFDTRLLRKVLIHVVPAGSPPLPPQLRNLTRGGRVRWITGRRSANENWDAFEGLTGRPLLALVNQPRSWTEVRFWLHDLATELALAQKEQTLPEVLALDRVWITAEGHAKLLDFPAPGIPPVLPRMGEPAPGAMLGGRVSARLSPVEFLQQVAGAALEGRVLEEAPNGTRPLAAAVPLYARDYLDKLLQLPDAAAALASLNPLLNRLPEVTAIRRAAIVACCLAFPVLGAIGAGFAFSILTKAQKSHPQIVELGELLQIRHALHLPWSGSKAPDDRWFAIYIASHYREAITNASSWSTLYARSMIAGESRRFAEQSLAQYPNPTEEEVREATKVLEPYVNQLKATQRASQLRWLPLGAFGGSLLVYVCLPALLAALLFRGGLVLLVLGVAVVRRDGGRAGRLRVFWRSLVAWSPLLAAPFLLLVLATLIGPIWGVALVALVNGALTVISLWMPERSLQDRIAGTCLVPR